MHLIDIHYIKEENRTIAEWVSSICGFIRSSSSHNSLLQAVNIWIPRDHFPQQVQGVCHNILSAVLTHNWVITQVHYRAPLSGDAIAANRYVIHITRDTSDKHSNDHAMPSACATDRGYGQYLSSHDNINFPTKLILRKELPMNTFADHDPTMPRSLAILRSSTDPHCTTISAADLVLDPAFPATEPVAAILCNSILGRRFGIPSPGINNRDWRIRSLTNSELLQTYSIPASAVPHSTHHTDYSTLLDDLLPFSVPWKLRLDSTNSIVTSTGILDQFAFSNSMHCDTMQCYFTKRTPETLDWTTAYHNDPSTQCIMSGLGIHKANEWSKADLKN